MNRFPLATLIILAAATLTLQAEAPRYGVQGLVNIPLGDLKDFVDSKPGPGVGVHGTFDLGAGHMLRPRLDFSIYPEANLGTVHHKANVLSLGGDYLYFVAGKPEGLYLTGGISAMRWSFDTQADSWSTTKLGVAIGVGYQWNATVGTEGRFVRSEVAQGFQADALQAGVTIRF
jgi:hypothetical protein